MSWHKYNWVTHSKEFSPVIVFNQEEHCHGMWPLFVRVTPRVTAVINQFSQNYSDIISRYIYFYGFVPIPLTCMVLTGTSTVMDMPTRIIPVNNPMLHLLLQ